MTLTVGDGLATDVETTTVEVSDEPFATTMHVSDLDGTANDLGRFWQALVTITVLDDAGSAVPNATVYGTWSGNTSGAEAVTTDSYGQATVVWYRQGKRSEKTRILDEFVTLTGDVATCDSLSADVPEGNAVADAK